LIGLVAATLSPNHKTCRSEDRRYKIQKTGMRILLKLKACCAG